VKNRDRQKKKAQEKEHKSFPQGVHIYPKGEGQEALKKEKNMHKKEILKKRNGKLELKFDLERRGTANRGGNLARSRKRLKS